MDSETAAVPTPQAFACPECRAELAVGTPACPRCGIRLVGPLAQQLWRVDQQIAQLTAESRRLRGLLLQPPGPQELPQGVPPVAGPLRLPTAPPVTGSPVAPGRGGSGGPSGQQLLLGLAALLLLSGVAFFLLVVWSLIGLVGQALVMVVLTVTAAWGAVQATRKRLPAAAETAAVIASGFVVLDLSAAHNLGLAGLDRVDGSAYWTGAGLLGAGVLLAFDRWVPRRDDAGELQRILTYRPVALALATVALWAGAWTLTPGRLTDVTTSGLALVLVVLSVGLVLVGTRVDEHRGLVSLSSVVPWLSAAYALLMHLGVALGVGYGAASTLDRTLATVLLLVVPTALLVAQGLPLLAGRRDLRVGLRLVGLLGVAVALGVPVFAAPRLTVALVAVVLGVGLVALAVMDHDSADQRAWPDRSWGDDLTWVGRVAVGALFFLLYLLIGGGHASGADMDAWRSGAGSGQWWLPLLPAAALVVPSTVTVVRRGSVPVAVLAHLAALAGVLLALRDAEPILWAVVTLGAAVVSVAVAAVSRWSALDVSGVSGEGRGLALETIALVGATVYAAASVGAALDDSEFVLSAVLVGLGAVLLAYAVLPGRLGAAYGGVAALSLALWVQLADRGVDAVEWYALPTAAMLAMLGAVHWHRDRTTTTWLTMAPAVATGLLPSLLVALAGDSLVRLAAVTAVSVLLLVVGVAQRWQAPVVLSALALALVAWTQGGPLVAYVDGWVLLTGSGLVLLVIGIQWERSVALGRRTWTWLGAMQ